MSVLGAALLRLGDEPGAARLLAAGDAWRQARGMAIVGLLADRTIAAATEDLAALPRTREIEAAESNGLTVRFGWLDALQLPDEAGYPTDAATARPTVRPEKMQPPRKVPSSAR